MPSRTVSIRAASATLFALLMALSWAAVQGAKADLGQLKTKGFVAIMRHAEAPGGGDPPGYKLDDCSTQRNLDDKGRDQARRAGETLRNKGITFDRVASSVWCRAQETAELVTRQKPEVVPALNSFFDKPADGPRQIAELKQWLQELGRDENVLLVTHQVVIAGLTKLSVASGEMVVLRRSATGGFTVSGRIAFK